MNRHIDSKHVEYIYTAIETGIIFEEKYINIKIWKLVHI